MRIAKPSLGHPLIVAGFLLVLVAAPVGYYEWKNRVGFRNLDICEQLQPGITVSELERALGAPIRTWVEKNGETWEAFKTASIAAGPISAEIDPSSGRVLTLRCSEDGPPTWTVR